ncbi:MULTISPECIES: hypothetical protein [unclassified Streptomyces]|uniref:hypothetical protein n=1 Tax=unclassified Streptomyces TaxID=2593676 RepID=UPI000AC08761|nr:MULTISPECIES: hypothetical protein [unclassified Streptomyces]
MIRRLAGSAPDGQPSGSEVDVFAQNRGSGKYVDGDQDDDQPFAAGAGVIEAA